MPSVDNPTTGTTSPVYIPRAGGAGRDLAVGEHYFAVQIRAAQAVFRGPIYERAQRLIVASRIAPFHRALGDSPLQALRHSRQVARGRAEQLGLAKNLIDIVPATMDHVSIAIDFILDKQNRLAMLGGLINEGAFSSVLSLVPGAAVAATTLGSVAGKLLTTFFAAEEREPILEFSGDFGLGSGDLRLREGFFAIFGTRDPANPLPRPLPGPPALTVENGELLHHGQAITQWSYILLEVHRLDARTRDKGVGTPWYARLLEAENMAQDVAHGGPLADAERRARWEACQKALREMRTLLQADPSYLPAEAQRIVDAAFLDCEQEILGARRRPARGVERGELPALQPYAGELVSVADRSRLAASVLRYADQVAEARQIMERYEL